VLAFLLFGKSSEYIYTHIIKSRNRNYIQILSTALKKGYEGIMKERIKQSGLICFRADSFGNAQSKIGNRIELKISGIWKKLFRSL